MDFNFSKCNKIKQNVTRLKNMAKKLPWKRICPSTFAHFPQQFQILLQNVIHDKKNKNKI